MKKRIGFILSAVLVPVVLAGCGSSGNADREASGSTVPSQATQAVQTTQAEEKAEIYYTTWRSNAEKNYPQVLIDEFRKKYPNITVIAQTNTTTTEEYLNDQKVRFLAGSDIDVTTIRAESRADYVKAGYLKDLTGQPFLKNFTEYALKAVAVDGKVYSAPSALNIAGAYYNFLQYGEEPQIPSEQELCEQYEISRPTVRQAVSGLAGKGYLYKD